MKTYGKFEAVRELYETPTGSVWQARTFGTKGPLNCMVKVVQPEKFVFAATSARLTKASVGPAEALLISAALQQNLANRSEFWAPIYHMGTDGKVAFYVTKAYERSAQRLIETKTPVTSADLSRICSAVVNGLSDLRDNYDRAHANLKPGNVLIGGSGTIDSERIVLCDPAVNGDPGPSLTRPPDTKALGEIIYGLVTSRPHSSARFPVQSSEEWARLGRSGPQWLALCNDLLNTMAADGPMSLALAQARVKQLRPSRRRVSRKWLALAALFALAAAGYIYRQPIIDTAKTQYAAIITKFTPAKPVAKKPRGATSKPGVVETKPTTVAIATPPLPKVETVVIQPLTPPASQPIVVQAPTPPPMPKIDLTLENNRQSLADRASQVASPDFLPPKAQSAYENLRDNFVARIRKSSDPTNDSQEWTKTNDRIMALGSAFPKPERYTDQPWQTALHDLAMTRRETALIAAVQRPEDAPAGLPMDRFNSLSKSLALAQVAVEQGDALAHADTIHDAEKQIANFTDDAPVLTIIKPAADELAAIAPVWSADNDALLAIAKDTSRPTMTRVVAWQRLDVADKTWPATADQFSQDRSLYKSLRTGLINADSPAVKPLDAIAAARSNRFFENLAADSLPAAFRWQNDNSDILPADQCPVWFQYDLALFRLKNEPAVQPGDSAVQALLKSSTAAGGNADVAQLTQALSEPVGNNVATTLDTAGPAGSGWRIRQRAGSDRWIVYLSGSRILEFARIEASEATPAFYLATTEVPIGLVKEMLAADPKSVQTFKSLNPVDTTVDAPGVIAWDFLPGTAGIELNEEGFKKYLRVAPTEDMPIQRVTPQGAMFLARQIGCRLPTAAEWQAALKQVENSTDAEARGFATLGWKLRDRNYARLRLEPLIWPDDHIFLGPNPSKITHHGASATVWNSAEVEKLNGELVTDTPDYKAVGNLAFLTANSGAAFRGVGNSMHVFHDLVGNVAEFVTIENNEIAVIGGSALSPPELDPMTPAKLPTDIKSPSFADVGFRLAFSDPKSSDNTLQSAIRMARYITAPK